MIKTTLTILSALVWSMLPCLAVPPHLAVVAKKKSAASTPWTQVLSAGNSFSLKCGETTANVHIAHSFVAANSGTVSSIDYYCREFGIPGAHTFSMALHADNTGEPAASALETISGITYASLAGTPTLTTFTFSSPPSITASNTYWIVIKADQTDASNYVQFYRLTTGTATASNGTATPVWTVNDSSSTAGATINGTD